MNRTVLMVLSVSCLTASGGSLAEEAPGDDVVRVIFEVGPRCPLGAPMGVTVSVENLRAEDVVCDLSYPGPIVGLEVATTNKPGITKCPTDERARDGLRILSEMKARGTLTTRVFLNRYLEANKPGKYDVDMSLRIRVWSIDPDRRPMLASVRTIQHKETLTVNVVEGRQEEITALLDKYAQDLKSSERRVRQGAVEALSTLSNPVVVPYLAGVASVREGEVEGARALSRFKTEQVTTILRSLLKQADMGVAEVVISALTERGIQLSDEEIEQLLKSRSGPVRYMGVQYAINNKHPVPAALKKRLVEDPNPRIKAIAETMPSVE